MKRSTQRENSSSGGGNNQSSTTTTRANHRTGTTSLGQIILVVVVLIIIVGLTLTQQSIERNSLMDMITFETTTTSTSSDDSSSSPSSTNGQPQQQQQRHAERRKPNHRYSKSSQKYSPISCHELFGLDAHEKRHGATHISDPNEGIVHARRTITPPYFWMSLHQHDYDRTRWAIMEYGFYYERQQSRAFIQILKSTGLGKRTTTDSSSSAVPPPLHVVDVGGNIGWYSMLSVATALSSNRSIVIDVFEPNPRNRYRMCESLQMNHWIDHELVDFHIYPLGVSSSSGGKVRMSIADSGVGKLGRVSLLNETENINLSLVSLDDMSTELDWDDEKSGPIAILKVDVEGLELEVFQGAQRLLQSGRVENIFFEGNARDDEEAAKFQTLMKLLVQSGYHAYKHGSWMGPHKLIATNPVPKHNAKEQEDVVVTYVEALIAECGTNHVVSAALAAAGQKSENAQCNLWWRKTPDTQVAAAATR